MCSVIAGLTALAGAVQYKSQQEQADAQAAAYRAQAEANERNAQIENRRQEAIADSYAQQDAKKRERMRLTEGQQRAAAGSAGIGFSGSAMDILSSSLEDFRNDQITSLTNQRNDNYNSRLTESNYINQANANRAAANNVERASRWQRVGTILGTASSIWGMSSGGSSTKSTTETPQFQPVTTNVGYGTNATFTPSTGAMTFARTQKNSYFPMNRNGYNFTY